MAFFDIKVFNPLASSYASSSLAQCFCYAELDKKFVRLKGVFSLLKCSSVVVEWDLQRL